MNFSTLKKLYISGIELVKLTIDGVLAWKRGYTNLVPLSTEADGVTVYNNGLGYKEGYRVHWTGDEKKLGGLACTGYIPFVKGDKLYIYPAFTGMWLHNTVTFFDSTFAFLGHITDDGRGYGICNGNVAAFKTTLGDGVSILDLSNNTVSGVENIAYVRVTNDTDGSGITSGAEMIITKNEEIEL